MKRIGDVAKQFDISNRTLRYWEETGILQSVREKNGYRYYDEENLSRIKQIVLLRRLRVPIADIETMFRADDPVAATEMLAGHLANLRGEEGTLQSLSTVVEYLLRYIENGGNTREIFAYLETKSSARELRTQPGRQPHGSGENIEALHGALQLLLFERRIPIMPEKLTNGVRIVKLPPMTVASYRAESETPEADSGKIMTSFILENNLQEWSGFRHIGFNNPDPTEGNPVYGYEIWIAVPDDFEIPAPLEKKRYEGGLYASISTRIGEIGERWMRLFNWAQTSEKYDCDESRQWLEECVDFDSFLSENEMDRQLDLLVPIRLRE